MPAGGFEDLKKLGVGNALFRLFHFRNKFAKITISDFSVEYSFTSGKPSKKKDFDRKYLASGFRAIN